MMCCIRAGAVDALACRASASSYLIWYVGISMDLLGSSSPRKFHDTVLKISIWSAATDEPQSLSGFDAKESSKQACCLGHK